MKIKLEKDDGTVEEVNNFVLIDCNVDHQPFLGTVISNIDEYYVPYILGDHSRWIFEARKERMKMWTLEMLNAVPKHTLFATGILPDNENGLFMANTGKDLRWIAESGEIGDWAIYCHFAENSVEYIRDYGDKVCDERNIRRCVPCDDEVFARYRY